MSTINNDYGNFMNSMFSSINTGSSASSSNILGDYAAIKNGSYKKLLNAYYAKQEAENASSATSEEKNVTLLAQDAKELKSAAAALKTTGSKSLFKEEIVSETDKETGEVVQTAKYNLDKLFKAAGSLVDAYNSLLDSAAEVPANVVEKKMALTANMLQKNSGLLEDIGISIEEGGKLKIDEEKFKAADISALKTVFNGVNSIADKLAKRASDIYSTAEKILSNTAGTYNRSGTLDKNITTGTLVDELL